MTGGFFGDFEILGNLGGRRGGWFDSSRDFLGVSQQSVVARHLCE